MNARTPSVEASQQTIGSTMRLILIMNPINKDKVRQAITNKALIIFFVLKFFIPK